MPASMSPQLRQLLIRQLRAIWDRRDVGQMSDADVRRLKDSSLTYLLRWWTYQEKWWDHPNPEPFREEPPRGYVAMMAETEVGYSLGNKPVKPYTDLLPVRPQVRIFGRYFGSMNFSGFNGGGLTPRQQRGSFKITGS